MSNMFRKILFFFLVIGISISAQAQLSDLHYLPPLKQGANNQGISQQAIYLSTPEPTTFTVNVYQGTNAAAVTSFNISSVNPAVYNLANGDNNITLVNNDNTGVVLTNSGLRFESPSGNKFYVNYRGNSSAQAASLTSKGRVAMGTQFKWGGVPNLGNHYTKSNTLGIMATEDNTTIDVFGYDADCEFRIGNNVAGITDNTYQIILDANESFVFEAYVGNSPTQAQRDGWIGASVVSDKDIVISNGAMNFGRQVGAGNRDAGIDQPVPENRLGKEYVFVRGNGHTNGTTEFPLVIAISDNTQIYVNGSNTPIATINNGEYFEIPSTNYSSNTVGANMLVKTSKDVYAYQCLAGASQVYTTGLNFVAPVNCLLPDVMDNIPDIRNMAGTTVTGGLTIIAAVNTPDANIEVTDGNGNVTLPASSPVAGSTDWKTFFIPNLNGDVSVQSTGPMAVGFFGYNGAKGVAGYFSGFDTVPVVQLEIVGGGGCLPNSDVAEVTGNFDAYQWFFDGVLIPGENSSTFKPTVAGEFFCRGTKGPCTYDSQTIFVYYCDPDVIINKSVDKSEIIEGETAIFEIEVQNFGVLPLTNLQITDNLPAGLTLVSASTSTGSWSGNTWNIGTLNGGESAVLNLEVRGDEIDIDPLVNLVNTVSHTQDQVDLNISEDSPSTGITVHNDFDNDGIKDITDVDDDNDGIYDEDECSTLFCFEPIVNESFEDPKIPSGTYRLLNENDVPGWQTTATDGLIEFWTDSFLGVPSFDGNQFAELNATQNSALYQNLCLTPGTVMNWSLRHRGRSGVDVMQVRIGADLATATIQQTISDDNVAWGFYSGTYTVPVGQINTVFIFEAVSTAGGGLSVGNLIDDIKINVASVQSCDDTDNDGYPDNLDLDSDGDGCSDANEYYKDENADGGDGGEYGSGTPAVDPITGAVLAASYVKVLAPEILLGNTSEDLGGTDINGQDVSLGQTFEYVLRFQNTGDDNAVNYTIRDVLPDNVTFNSVNISNAPGTTHSYDLVNNTINFQVPNSLVEIGDPEYSIRINVTIALNCSDFVAACSSTLENHAFSTYNGAINTMQFTDENDSNSITGCPTTPEVASNSILNDLTSCNEARIVQLCGDDVILSAGSGFTTYNWVLDLNGNGQVDATDTVLNDGDPDSDPSTLLVTQIGSYIVEKSASGGCPDLIERITVERFGATQTNPIVNYFNQVNSDANPDNDMQGEIVTCAVDGDLLPQIFLCGVNDEATIQLGITDAQSIVWEKLNEGSCTDASDDCANKNGSCSWSEVDNDDNITLTDSGEYRVVIIYQNGCFSRFYFNVFKNELDVNYTSSDILCSTDGNIRITNVGSGYGFQLIDAANNDNIIVPFSANNGSSFDIASSGTYVVQVTQLDPINGTPIAGSCIFESEEIGILERNFSVTLSTTPKDCNDLGTISVQALNALPNYSYELRLDDGSNAGQGSLVSSQPTNTDNTFTFSNVNPGNYIVVTTTEDGCIDSQQITVTEIPELLLVAITSQNISCASGIVTLTPSGGSPNPDYEMAIWSKDGVDLYANTSDILPGDLQTGSNFLFSDSLEAGEYTFIVFDDNNCSAISNSVTVLDLGIPVLSASHTTITCADSATSELTVTVSGGTSPYQYSLDGGATVQTTNTFVNLAAGLYTITVIDASNNAGTGCIETLEYEIDQPFRLTASATIVEDASCNPAGAMVKILNANGGQAPYEYSFNGGSSFSTNNALNLSSGNYDLVVRDNLGCSYSMELTVPSNATDPTFDNSVDYACDGLGTITMTPSNTTDFTYSYTLNGTLNTPSDNNIFTNVAVGTQTVTVGYASALAANQSNLFFEDFDAGPNTQIGEIGPGYCYEPQDGSITACNLGPAGILANGEYTVTNFVTNPVPGWRSPNDHTAMVDGRFLAIDVSTLAGSNGILWARRNIEVLPNRDISLSLWAYNLLRTTGSGNNPEILIELVDGTGTVISSIATAEIPKNTNADDWHNRTVTFNPGLNTSVDIVLRTNLDSDFGNDLIIDDIQAFQIPEVCEKTVDITVVIEDNQEFSSNLLGTTDPSCNGSADGSVRFEVLNYDNATGFEYSTDGGTNWTTSLTSPITTSATLSDGTYNVLVRKISDTSCTSDFDTTLTEPTIIVPLLSQTAEFTCFNTGATLEASATGGSPVYEYQLENSANTVIVAYQSNTTFTNVIEGDYVVRVRDTNGCDIVSTTSITVVRPTDIAFDLTATACYDGLNNASVTAAVTAGNGGYQFRINGGAWLAPTPSTATSYTFNALSNGTYTVEVTDVYGCVSTIESITIQPQILANIDVVDISSCADGSITVTPTGGDGSYVYAFLISGTTVQDSDFAATNVFTITDASVDYDVYVRDNNGVVTYCQFLETVEIDDVPPLTYTAIPTDAICYGDDGRIAVSITAGLAPFTYELVDIDHSTNDQIQSTVLASTKTYFNLTPGNYNVIITDAMNCSLTVSGIVVAQPDELVATITGVTPANCTGDVNDFGFTFSAYPTTLGVIEFSADGGSTWVGDNSNPGTTDRLTGYLSGDTVNPSMRTIDGSGNTVCQVDLPPFIIPYPLDDLDISISTVVVNCNELQVTVQGSEGVAPYEYAFSDNPGNFDTATATWIVGGTVDNLGNTVAAGEGMHVWGGLVPGKTYIFYVRDFNGCIRQSNVNVNDITTNPMEITATYEPSCNGANDGEITYTIVDSDGSIEPNMNWTLFDIDGNVITSSAGNVPYSTSITINGLSADEYYIVVTQIDGGGTPQCNSGSENLIIEELDAITASLNIEQNISCEAPGIISINNIQGGGGTFTYTVTGPAPFVTVTGTTDNPVEILPNSPAGNYNVQITDQFGCSNALGSVALTLAANPIIVDVAIDNCSSAASVTINATSTSATILYSIDGGSTYVNNGGVFNNVIAGNYTVFIKDGNGCTDSQVIDVQPTLQATASLAKNLGCGIGQEAEISIDVTFGSGNYDYEIIGTSGTIIARQVLSSNPLTALITLADTYTVNVYDNATSGPECSRSFNIVVPPSIVPDFTADPTDISCFGSTDGTIVLTQTNNGNNPLVYSLLPNSGTFNAATSTYENLPTGTYAVTALGPNGCETIINNILVDDPGVIVFDLPIVTPFGCTSGNTTDNAGIVINTASLVGGSGTYVRYEFIDVVSGNILQNGTNVNYIYTDLTGGDVLVRVHDDNGCSGEMTVTVPAFDALGTATVTVDNAISCSTFTENISIDITSSLTNYTSNPANYEFRQLPSGAFQASNQFINLAPGSYTFSIRNISTGCEITIDHSIADPNTFDVTVEKLADVTCFGDNGSIRLLMSDATYTGSFTWSIYNTNGTPADRSDDGASISTGSSPDFGPTTAIAVPAGNYLVEVIQDGFPNCGQVRTFSITTPSAAIALEAIDMSTVGCSDDQGSASITPTGGLAPYDITLTNNNTGAAITVTQVNANLFQNLTAGQYTIDVTDALGCPATFVNQFELILPDAISGTISATDLLCQGDTDATVSIGLDPRNVSPNYSYVLKSYGDNMPGTLVQSSVPQTVATFDNLGPGFYSILVEDDMHCSFESALIEIVDPTEVNAMLLTTATLGCLAGAELQLSASGGTAPYMYSTDGSVFNAMNETLGANTHLFQNLSAGSYQYYIRDSFNCVSILSNEIVIDAIVDLSIEVDASAAVINCNGESTAFLAVSATGGLGNYQYALFSDASLTNEIRPYQITGDFADLPAGSYYINVQSEDCELSSQEIIISEPEVLVIVPTITDVSCNGADDGQIEFDVTGGSGEYQFAITPNLNQFDDENLFENLAVGDYTVIVQDVKGCFELIEFSITEPAMLEMTLSATPEICAGDSDGSISVVITGGTAPYSTAINSTNDVDFVEGRLTMENLVGETYFIYVKDANGCEVNSAIVVETGANLNATVEVIYECTGDTPNNSIQIVLEDETVSSDVLYALDSVNPSDLVLDPDFENMTPGDHYLTIVHANGCLNTIDFVVEAYEPLVLSLEQLDLNEITANAAGGRPGYTYYFNEENNGDDNTFYIKRTDTYTVRVVDENGCESIETIFMEFIDIEIPNFFTPDGDGKNDTWLPRNISQFPEIFIKIYDRYGREVYEIIDNEKGWDGLYQQTDLPTGDYWYVIKLNGEDDEREFVGNFTLYR